MPRPPLPRDVELNLYVPRDKDRLGLAPASAVVGVPFDDDERKVRAYYEGAIYGQDMSFEEKVQHAAGRLADSAPTTAFGFYDVDELILVGKVARSEKLAGWIVTEVFDRTMLEAWAGETVSIGGSDDMKGRAAGIRWARLTPQQQIEISRRSRNGENIVALVLDIA